MWSTDGARIFFVSTRSGAFHIHAINPDGTNVQCITCDIVFNANSPALLP
jgi:hypothetical protein